MFKIYDGRSEFWQWDLNQRLIVNDAVCCEVHFCNKTTDNSLVCAVYEENGQRLVDVPNILLQTARLITVYAYMKDDTEQFTKVSDVFLVRARTKPESYVYTETEVMCYESLDERIKSLEEGGSGAGTNGLGACILMTTEHLATDATEASKSLFFTDDPEAPEKFMDYIAANGGTALLLSPNGNLFNIMLHPKIEVADGWVAISYLTNVNGKSAYEFAVAGGYTGTEAEFAEKLAAENYTKKEADNKFIPKTGGYVNGDLSAHSFRIYMQNDTGGVSINAYGDYQDGEGGFGVEILGSDGDEPIYLGGIRSPKYNLQAANKEYVDNVVSDLEIPTVQDILDALPTWTGGSY